jgi:hypothetical protein
MAEEVNKSLMDKTVPKRNETVLGVMEGTLLETSEELMLASLGWRVDKTKIVKVQEVEKEVIYYEGMYRKRGQPPRDDRKGDTITEQVREKDRKEKKDERAEKKAEKEREKEENLRPRRRGNRQIRKVGVVTKEMEKKLKAGINSKARVRYQQKREDDTWYFEVEARGGGYHGVVIGQFPSCTCEDFRVGGPGGSGTWVHCKHIYAVLVNGLGVTWDTESSKVQLVHQSAFTKEEVRRILGQRFDEVAMSGSKAG